MPALQIILSAVLAVLVLAGISMMSKVRTAVAGNLLSAFAMLCGIVGTLFFAGVVSVWTIYVSILIGALIGGLLAARVQMIQMPQTVALFNGLGGGASALVGLLSVHGDSAFVRFTALLAVAVGMVTLEAWLQPASCTGCFRRSRSSGRPTPCAPCCSWRLRWPLWWRAPLSRASA